LHAILYLRRYKSLSHHCIKKIRLYSLHRRFVSCRFIVDAINAKIQSSMFPIQDFTLQICFEFFSGIKRQDVAMETEYAITQLFFFSDIVSITCFVFHILLQINVNNKFLNFIHPFTFDMNFTVFPQISS